MSWSRADIGDQTGRVAVITGANSGLGLEIAASLAEHGATVVLACRNLEKAEKAKATILRRASAATVLISELDLADLSSVSAFTARFAREHDRLDLLVNNAGLMAVDQSTTAQGFETQFGVNHLGHFLLTEQLLPVLDRTPGARVANMASMGHRPGRMHFDDLMGRRHYGRWSAYFQSKLSNILFTKELQRRLEASGSSTIAVVAHPGGTRTDLGSEGTGITSRISTFFYPYVTQPVRSGALPMLRALTAPDVAGGEFYGPRFVVVGRAVRETPSRRARSAADAARLWAESEQLIAGATF